MAVRLCEFESHLGHVHLAKENQFIGSPLFFISMVKVIKEKERRESNRVKRIENEKGNKKVRIEKSGLCINNVLIISFCGYRSGS